MCIESNPCSSCIEARMHQKPTGVYWIGNGTHVATQTYCLMEIVTEEGICDLSYCDGGWSLLLKAKPGTTFSYDSEVWTSSITWNTDTHIQLSDGRLNMLVDSKYDVFNWLPVSEYLVWHWLPGASSLKSLSSDLAVWARRPSFLSTTRVYTCTWVRMIQTRRARRSSFSK